MLIKPIITEKSSQDAKNHIYTFAVSKSDTKFQIKNAVEQAFGVKVKSVKSLIVPGKSYRTGRRWHRSHRSNWKKALVQINSDQKIDLWP